MRVVLACSAACAAIALLAPSTANAQCVDEELKQELVGGRHYRGVQERLFTKAFRHELSPMGGWYAADLYSASYIVGGAYTFHFSEDLGLEASFQLTRFDFNAALGAGVTDDSTSQGLTGSFGFGTKWYLGKWFAVRIDVRDHILKETLIGEEHLVNDVLVTGGFSIFIPFGG
jgi:hypothetical protein